MKETMEKLEQIGLNEELKRKVAKKMVKKIAKVNGELFFMRFNENKIRKARNKK